MKRKEILEKVSFFILVIKLYPAIVLSIYLGGTEALFQGSFYSLMLLLICLFGFKIKLEPTLLWLVLAAVLSIIVNSTAQKYNSPLRFSLWVILIMAVGPLIYNSPLVKFRNRLLEKIMFCYMIGGSLSCLYWILGLPSIGAGHFSGIMVHSMLLAPVAALGGLFAFFRFIYERGKRKLLYFVFFLFNGVSVYLAASRVSFIAFIAAFTVYLIINKFPLRKVSILMVVCSIALLSLNYGDINITQSEGEGLLARDLENTRDTLWNDRINEFKSSPLVGVGFAAQNDLINEQVAETEGGQVEPGSTYLMVLSMTGLAGGLAFIIFILKPMISRRFWFHIIKLESYKLAAFVFFAIHFVAEGYIFSAGALMAFTFWLLMGATYPYKYVRFRIGRHQ